MKWYAKYLEVYERPFENVPLSLVSEISKKLKEVQSSEPLVSVIAIAHNEESRILACLWSLSENICKYPLEIICVNNNSSDNTKHILKTLGINYLNESKKGPGHARNCGIAQAKGKFTVCIDSDTLYPPHYIETMVSALQKPGISAVFSLWSYIPGNGFTAFKLRIYEVLRDFNLVLLSRKSPERCVRGMVFAHSTEPARSIGYKTNIKRGEDGYMACKLKDYGKLLFLRNRRTRVMTSTGTLKSDGTLGKALWVRVLSALRGYRKYLRKTKGEIKDREYNLLDNNK